MKMNVESVGGALEAQRSRGRSGLRGKRATYDENQHNLAVIAREPLATAAIQLEFQMDCFVAALLAMTQKAWGGLFTPPLPRRSTIVTDSP